jgi:hypothetical protein
VIQQNANWVFWWVCCGWWRNELIGCTDKNKGKKQMEIQLNSLV